MNYKDSIDLIEWLNDRFRKSGMQPWYLWAVNINWSKLKDWSIKLSYNKIRSK